MNVMLHKKTKKMTALLLAVTALTGCSGKVSQSTENTWEPASETSTYPSTLSSSKTGTTFQETTLNEQELSLQEKAFSRGINQFSYGIFEKADSGKNVFLSPYSIATALSMLANGAEGKTKEELMSLFGIQDLDKWNAYIKEYTSQYQEESTKLLTANSVWLSNQLTLSPRAEQEFFAPLATYYHTKKKQTDLSTNATREEINNWVFKHTNGMISPFLTDNIETTQMLLVNAVYFAGNWEEEFKEEDTEQLAFHGADKETTTDMMCKYKKNSSTSTNMAYKAWSFLIWKIKLLWIS